MAFATDRLVLLHVRQDVHFLHRVVVRAQRQQTSIEESINLLRPQTVTLVAFAIQLKLSDDLLATRALLGFPCAFIQMSVDLAFFEELIPFDRHWTFPYHFNSHEFMDAIAKRL